MIVGSRILRPAEVGRWDAEILQISVYHGMEDNIDLMKKCVRRCREEDIRFVLHPVGYFLLQDRMFKDLLKMAHYSDLALILHDEKTPGGKRLENHDREKYRKALGKLSSITPVSIENATDTRDILWFWEKFADSATLDIGHIESSHLDSVKFVKSLDETTLNKIRFVHMHRNNGLRGGITDHWPLSMRCRETRALGELVKQRPDVSVILELNETDRIGESLGILRRVRDTYCS